MEAQKLVSIIIPAYNVENYIDECLESIMSQTYPNWEALVIDDGSTDSTWQHIESFVSKDSRFRAFLRENSGVSATRNFALEQANGAYIQFLDSDDYIVPETLQKAVDAMENTDVDWVSFQHQRINEAGELIDNFDFVQGRIDISSNPKKIDLITNPLLDYKIGYEVWNKLYKASIIQKHHIRFLEDCHIGEDLEFNLCYILFATVINCVDSRLYFYRQRISSAMKQNDTLEKNFEERLKLVKGFYPVLEEVMGQSASYHFYKIFYKLMIGCSQGYTAEDALKVAKEKGGDFYKKWMAEAMQHKSEFKTFYPPEKVKLFYHFGLYIYSCLVDDTWGKLYLKFYNIYRTLRKRPAIEKWQMP
ncbi:Glycosyltransferase involved in cell wall bisynthesis [Pseudobutyrivibrio sp. YE44]|nr:Glycosyltransferase involved in cell wall bisynthesis [Pseudobutyrivibrio sp. YE44]